MPDTDRIEAPPIIEKNCVGPAADVRLLGGHDPIDILLSVIRLEADELRKRPDRASPVTDNDVPELVYRQQLLRQRREDTFEHRLHERAVEPSLRNAACCRRARRKEGSLTGGRRPHPRSGTT